MATGLDSNGKTWYFVIDIPSRPDGLRRRGFVDQAAARTAEATALQRYASLDLGADGTVAGELARWLDVTSIRGFETCVVPGLLQTAEYARHRIAEMPALHKVPEDVDQAVAVRMQWQQVLYDPAKMTGWSRSSRSARRCTSGIPRRSRCACARSSNIVGCSFTAGVGYTSGGVLDDRVDGAVQVG